MRETICTVLGVIGGTLAAAFGGWNAALTTLVFFLSLDYLTNNNQSPPLDHLNEFSFLF